MQTFREVIEELNTLQEAKGADYGDNKSPLANLVASADFGIEPWVATMIRLNDKLSRIKSFINNGRVVNESVEDSLKDIAVYAIHALRLYRKRNTP